jgi:ABC-2 type transport system permease protein
MAMPLAVKLFAMILPLTHLLKVQAAMLLGPIGRAQAWDPIVVLLAMALFWNLLRGRLMFMRWKRAAKREAARNLTQYNTLTGIEIKPASAMVEEAPHD